MNPATGAKKMGITPPAACLLYHIFHTWPPAALFRLLQLCSQLMLEHPGPAIWPLVSSQAHNGSQWGKACARVIHHYAMNGNRYDRHAILLARLLLGLSYAFDWRVRLLLLTYTDLNAKLGIAVPSHAMAQQATPRIVTLTHMFAQQFMRANLPPGAPESHPLDFIAGHVLLDPPDGPVFMSTILDLVEYADSTPIVPATNLPAVNVLERRLDRRPFLEQLTFILYFFTFWAPRGKEF